MNHAGADSQTLSFIFEMQSWLAQVLLGGFLDRYPNLKMAVFESNSQWLPYMLETCDRLFKLYANERQVKADRLPSEAFYEQCVISFESDEEQTMVAVGPVRHGRDLGVGLLPPRRRRLVGRDQAPCASTASPRTCRPA